MGNVLSCCREEKLEEIEIHDIDDIMSSDTSEAPNSSEIKNPFGNTGRANVYMTNTHSTNVHKTNMQPNNMHGNPKEEDTFTSPKVSPRRISSIEEDEILQNLPPATRRASQLPPLSQMSSTNTLDAMGGIGPFAPFGSRRSSSTDYGPGPSSPPTKHHRDSNPPVMAFGFPATPGPTDDGSAPKTSPRPTGPDVQLFDFSNPANRVQYAQDIFSSFGQTRAPTDHSADMPTPRQRAHTLGPVTGIAGGGGAAQSGVPISHKPRSLTIGPTSGVAGQIFGTNPRGGTAQGPDVGGQQPFSNQLSPRAQTTQKAADQIFSASPTPSGGRRSLSPTDPIREIFASTPQARTPSPAPQSHLPFQNDDMPAMTRAPALPPSRHMGATGTQQQMFSSLPPVKHADLGGPPTFSQQVKLPEHPPKKNAESHDNQACAPQDFDFPDFDA